MNTSATFQDRIRQASQPSPLWSRARLLAIVGAAGVLSAYAVDSGYGGYGYDGYNNSGYSTGYGPGYYGNGGVVYDSDPDAEWHETMNKGRALFRAVAQAAKGL